MVFMVFVLLLSRSKEINEIFVEIGSCGPTKSGRTTQFRQTFQRWLSSNVFVGKIESWAAVGEPDRCPAFVFPMAV